MKYNNLKERIKVDLPVNNRFKCLSIELRTIRPHARYISKITVNFYDKVNKKNFGCTSQGEFNKKLLVDDEALAKYILYNLQDSLYFKRLAEEEHYQLMKEFRGS